MVKVDLKDAYFTVPMHEEDRDFLKFTYENKTYRFNCLPFGLACAPWVFTNILRPVAAQLRQMGNMLQERSQDQVRCWSMHMVPMFSHAHS